MTEFFNIDNIKISDDEFIGNAFQNITINTPIKNTPYLQNIMSRLDNLCYDIFLKIGIDIAVYFMKEDMLNTHQRNNSNTDLLVVNEQVKKQCLLIYAAICHHLITSKILDEDEISDDVNDIQTINDEKFWERTTEILTTFSNKYVELLESYCQA